MKSKNLRSDDWHHYFYLNPDEKKGVVAEELGVSDAFFSKLIRPSRYRPLVNDDLAERIAEKWNQPVSYVRNLYRRAA